MMENFEMTKTSMIKTLVLATAAAAVLAAGPASARTRHHATPRAEATQVVPPPGLGTGPYYANDPYVVTDGSNYLGRDPDLQIRSEMLKDDVSHNGNNY
jgi:hypothetical protein